MKVVVLILFCIALVGIAWTMYRLLYVKRKLRKLTEKKFRIFESLIRNLTDHEQLRADDIQRLATDPSTRLPLFGILERFGQPHLFPADQYTLDKSAESFMVSWLEFPTELNASPGKIELLTKIYLPESSDVEYYVFKFTKPQPPAGSDEWFLGVVGPYNADSKPYDIPTRVFSRFNVIGTVSPLEEARWVHEHVGRK